MSDRRKPHVRPLQEEVVGEGLAKLLLGGACIAIVILFAFLIVPIIAAGPK